MRSVESHGARAGEDARPAKPRTRQQRCWRRPPPTLSGGCPRRQPSKSQDGKGDIACVIRSWPPSERYVVNGLVEAWDMG